MEQRTDTPDMSNASNMQDASYRAQSEHIFVSVASFCDDNLLFTLDSLFSAASNPSRVFVAVVNQTLVNEREVLKAKSWYPQIRYLHVDAVDSRGVCWARSLAFSLYRDEPWFLQIDSHTWFHHDWDQLLINLGLRIESEVNRPVITTYPPGFEFDDDDQPQEKLRLSDSVMVLRVHPETSPQPENPILRFTTDWIANRPYEPGFHIAGGFLFARGDFVRQVPYDPYLYFHGEEQSLAIRAWTKGWNIIHPRMSDIPLRHLYKSKGQTNLGHHWRADLEKERSESFSDLTVRARERLCNVVYRPTPGDPYGIGSERTLQEFALFSGLDYPNARVWRESDDQRKQMGKTFEISTLGYQGAHTRYGDMTVLANDRFISRSLHVYGQWAQNEINRLIEYVKPGDVVIDAGAYIGYTALALAHAVGNKGRVLAFEPHPQLYDLLQRNIEASDVGARIQLFQTGLGASEKRAWAAPLKEATSQNLGMTRLVESTVKKGHSVKICTIDSLNLPQCDAIKIDVAGAEVGVLRGAEQTIRKHRPAILVEFNEVNRDEIRAWFEQLQGYRLEPFSTPAFEPDNWRGEKTDILQRIVLYNVLAIPVRQEESAEAIDAMNPVNPDERTIFVQIASYKDAELYPTLDNLFEMADYPERVTVGVCLQDDPARLNSLADFLLEKNYAQQLRVSYLPLEQSRGAGYARSTAQSLARHERYTLQIDSHHRFVRGWDQSLINQYQRVKASHCVLTSFLPGYDVDGRLQDVDLKKFKPAIRCHSFARHGSPQMINLGGALIHKKNDELERSPFVVFNFVFTETSTFKQVPIDPNFRFYGDEFSFSLRLWTHGVDVYQLAEAVAYHQWVDPRRAQTVYKETNTSIWEEDLARMQALLAGNNDALGSHGIGKNRSIESFMEFAGIDFVNRRFEKKATEGKW